MIGSNILSSSMMIMVVGLLQMMILLQPILVDSFAPNLISPTTYSSPSVSNGVARRNHHLAVLYGMKKKGKLAQNVSSGGASTKKKKKKKKVSSSGNVSGYTGSSSGKAAPISSSLAEWAAEQQQQDSKSSTTTTSSSSTTSTTVLVDAPAEDDAASFKPFSEKDSKKKSNKNSRRERQAQKQMQQSQYNMQIKKVISSIEEMLGTNNFQVQDLLELLSKVVQMGQTSSISDTKSSSVKSLFQSKNEINYNLAWVGSDDAICHIGTGLHKVPLARLQDIFLTVGGSRKRIASTQPNGNLKPSKTFGSWYMYEVISILGPFPNVRNTLQGSIIELSQNNMKIEYDSIIDGTGKEVKAGKDDDVRQVELDILFADENIIVCEAPSDDEESMSNNGKNVLVFLKEDEMEEKLEAMRVA